MAESRHHLFSRLFLESGTTLRRYVRRLVRSRETAEEIVQEAFLRTYEYAQDGRPPNALLYAIARNLAMDHHRRERTARVEQFGEMRTTGVAPAGSGESLESWLLSEERSALLRRAVERLSPQCRVAFALKVFHGSSYQEIAEKLAISEKTVEAHISRGIRETYRYVRQRYQLKGASSDD